MTESSCGMPLELPTSRRHASSSAAVGGVVGRHVPDLLAGELFQPEVGARLELEHLHVLLDHGDERHEQRAVKTILVELRRRHVRGRHHHDAEFEQPGEQPAEDHGIGDVGDVEFVEAQQPAFLGDLAGGEPDGVVALDLAVLELLPEPAHAVVHIGHELVKVGAALADDRACLEEQVHQHGLAAADVAEDVEAFDRLAVIAAAEQPADRLRPPRGAMRGDALLQRDQPRQQALLRPVALELLGGDETFVEFEGRTWIGIAREGWRDGATDRAWAGGRQAQLPAPAGGMPAMQISSVIQHLTAPISQSRACRHTYAAVQQ